MSMNLHLDANRSVTVNKTGEQSIQTKKFFLYQTPTDATYACLATDDPAKAYREWVIENRVEYQEAIYADDDFFEDGEILGYKTICYADEHLEDFDSFIKECEEGGYELEFYAM
jgi:hypothetical protein